MTRGVLTLRAQRDLRAMAETVADEGAVLHDVLEYGGRWPARRFRVEGTAVGSSRLLRLCDAERVARHFGGRVVEVACSRDEWEAREAARTAAEAATTRFASEGAGVSP